MTNIALIEDDASIKDALQIYLSKNPENKIATAQNSVEDFLEYVKSESNINLDILLLDIGLPGMSGLEGIPLIKKLFPDLNIIMLTTYEEEDKIYKALCAGAISYISKRTSLLKICDAIDIVSKGGSYMSPSIARKVIGSFRPNKSVDSEFTPRQLQIINSIVEGLSYKMIAEKLMISIDTVRFHIKSIYKNLEINSKAELIKKSYDMDL